MHYPFDFFSGNSMERSWRRVNGEGQRDYYAATDLADLLK
jgi:hypothetical protein